MPCVVSIEGRYEFAINITHDEVNQLFADQDLHLLVVVNYIVI